jgi:hypothetical protein
VAAEDGWGCDGVQEAESEGAVSKEDWGHNGRGTVGVRRRWGGQEQEKGARWHWGGQEQGKVATKRTKLQC